MTGTEKENIIKNAQKGKIFLKNANVKEGRLVLEFEENDYSRFNKLELIITHKKTNIHWSEPIDAVEFETGTLSLNIDEFINHWLEPQNSQWSFNILGLRDEIYYLYAIKGRKIKTKKVRKDLIDKTPLYLDFVVVKDFNQVKWGMRPYFSEFMTLSLQSIQVSRAYMSLIEGEVLKVDIQKGILKIEAKLGDYELKPEGMVIKYRGVKESFLSDIEFKCNVRLHDKVYYISGELDLKKNQLKPMFADVFLKVAKADNFFDIPLYAQKLDKDQQFLKLFHPIHYRISRKFTFLPYVTIKKQLAFDYRGAAICDSFRFRLKERVAERIYSRFKEGLDQKNIMLVYEKNCIAAQENGFYFFQYCIDNNMEEYMNKQIFFIIDYKSPQYKNVKKYGKKILKYLSIRHMVYLFAAKLLVSSETKTHSYVERCNSSLIRRKLYETPSVFLQHGVIAFKKLGFLKKMNRNSRTNLFIASSYIEKDIIMKNLSYQDSEVAVTGLARWDLLEDKSEGVREILLMPTWRTELEELSDKEFQASSYFQQYMQLLNSKKLQGILKKYDLKLSFYIHPKLKKFFGNFSSTYQSIHLIPFEEQPLNELIMKCSMMITDYSSAVWDAYYLQKPVLFYQFDLEDYERGQGSYLDLRTELFGDAVYNQKDLLVKIEEVVNREFKEKEEYKKMRDHYLPYIDQDNRKRTCDAILNAGL